MRRLDGRNPSAPSGKPEAEMVQLELLYTLCMERDSCFQSSGLSCKMQRESIQMYWKPNFTVAKRASWNVLDRLSKGIDNSNVLRFVRVVVKNLVLPQQWGRVMYGVCMGSESPWQILADILELVIVESMDISLVGSTLWPKDDWHTLCSSTNSFIHFRIREKVCSDFVDGLNSGQILCAICTRFLSASSRMQRSIYLWWLAPTARKKLRSIVCPL